MKLMYIISILALLIVICIITCSSVQKRTKQMSSIQFWQQKYGERQVKSKETLKTVTNLLQEDQLCVFLDGGSMLGAVRHQNMIPWDDDIDIGVLIQPHHQFKSIQHRIRRLLRGVPHAVVVPIAFGVILLVFTGTMVINIDIFIYSHCADDPAKLKYGHPTHRLCDFGRDKYFFYVDELSHTIPCQFGDQVFQIPHGYESYITRSYSSNALTEGKVTKLHILGNSPIDFIAFVLFKKKKHIFSFTPKKNNNNTTWTLY